MDRFVTRLNASVECGTQAEVHAETLRSPQLPSTVSPETIAESDCATPPPPPIEDVLNI